jgi:hypothetical protein
MALPFLFVWTMSIKSKGHIAVMAQYSNSGRVVILLKPVVKAATATDPQAISVFFAPSVYMVQCQKLFPVFATTLTFMSICRKYAIPE